MIAVMWCKGVSQLVYFAICCWIGGPTNSLEGKCYNSLLSC